MDPYSGLEAASLSFDLDNLELLHSYQLALVPLHQSASYFKINQATKILQQRRTTALKQTEAGLEEKSRELEQMIKAREFLRSTTKRMVDDEVDARKCYSEMEMLQEVIKAKQPLLDDIRKLHLELAEVKAQVARLTAAATTTRTAAMATAKGKEREVDARPTPTIEHPNLHPNFQFLPSAATSSSTHVAPPLRYVLRPTPATVESSSRTAPPRGRTKTPPPPSGTPPLRSTTPLDEPPPPPAPPVATRKRPRSISSSDESNRRPDPPPSPPSFPPFPIFSLLDCPEQHPPFNDLKFNRLLDLVETIQVSNLSPFATPHLVLHWLRRPTKSPIPRPIAIARSSTEPGVIMFGFRTYDLALKAIKPLNGKRMNGFPNYKLTARIATTSKYRFRWNDFSDQARTEWTLFERLLEVDNMEAGGSQNKEYKEEFKVVKALQEGRSKDEVGTGGRGRTESPDDGDHFMWSGGPRDDLNAEIFYEQGRQEFERDRRSDDDYHDSAWASNRGRQCRV